MSEIKLYKGDCLVEMDKIADKSVDLILCDLPYGKLKSDSLTWDNMLPFDKLWKQYDRVIKDDGAVALFSTQPFTSRLINSNIENFKYEWIWKKSHGGNFATAKFQPMKEHENIEIFGKGKIRYYPIKEERHGSGKDTSKYQKKVECVEIKCFWNQQLLGEKKFRRIKVSIVRAIFQFSFQHQRRKIASHPKANRFA